MSDTEFLLERLLDSVDRSRSSGQIYFIESGPDKYIKIGFTQYVVSKRIATMQTGSPYPLKLIGVIRNKNRMVERLIHRSFKDERVHCEWFRGSERLLGFILKHAEEERITKTLLRPKRRRSVATAS